MYTSVLTSEQIQQIHSLDTVCYHHSQLDVPVVSFRCPLSDEIKAAIKTAMGLDLSSITDVPMRWIRGDTVEHVDVGPASFDKTYLIYLSSSEGEFVLDGAYRYPIQQGYGIQFNEGQRHETVNTGSIPRLLIGPMNDLGYPVGGSPLVYFASEADALTYTNSIGNGGTYTVQSFNGITSWRLASNSTGTSSQSATYYVGDNLNPDGVYILYPNVPCLLEGTTVQCLIDGNEQTVPIEKIRRGTLVKTVENGYRHVVAIGRSVITNSGSTDRSQNRLYVCRTDRYPELKTDLYLTGCHSLLVDELTPDQIVQTRSMIENVYITGKKYRLMACIDDRAEPWASEGKYTVWHLALENHYPRSNYGIFVNGSLLVETCSLYYLYNHSNMELL